MFPRHIQPEIESFAKIMPAVFIAGARQTGKTTLVESLGRALGYALFTFDDDLSLANARRDPSGWLFSLPKPVVLDEVQRLPEIFLSIKRDVDLHRIPGRYLLTGSANPLLLPKLGDSLAGRMGIVSMYPFSQGEIHRQKEHFIPMVFNDSIPYRKFVPIPREQLIEILMCGGFPSLVLLKSAEDRKRWMKSYLQTMMERDVRDLANIEGLQEFPRLFRLLASRSGMLLNMSDISRTLGIVNVTLNRYIRLLETLYFVYLLPAWYTNFGKRLIKSPKLHVCDTAILAYLLEADPQRLENNPSLMGQFLENFVFTELLKQKSWSSIPCELYHFRDGDYEVDFVLERQDGTIIGIEVKSARFLQPSDLRGLKHLQQLSKKHFSKGIVLHLGDQIESLGDNLWAVPLQALWE